MKKQIFTRAVLVGLLLIGSIFTSSSIASSINTSQNSLQSNIPEHQVAESTNMIDGQILFAPIFSTTTYLIDRTGAVNHTWSSSYLPGQAVYWLGDGTILRTIRAGVGPGQGGAGGGIQKVLWDGTITWDFRYNTNGNLSHHDIKQLPNGNVIMIAWETKTHAQAIAAGRNPNNAPNSIMPDHIIEVQPTGPTSGTIVWEWHVWDHLIQDYDSSKANYGVVADHPELVNINFGPNTDDWMHTNSIDYDPTFDQILISIHNFNEIWVIDHSTTTQQAAGHTGGNSGQGGDLLYRWGNPQAYNRGTSSDEKLFAEHDATWIDDGLPGAGHILIFNNGANRPGSHYSTVDEIIPPVDANGTYYLAPGSAYGPINQIWIYTANPPTNFYADKISGATRLSDGNTLICNGPAGKFFEVTPTGAIVWQYNNSYPTPATHDVFKIVYIPPDEPPEPGIPNLYCSGSLSWTKVQPGGTVNGSFQVQNIGSSCSLLNWTINVSSLSWGTWTFTPANGENLTPEDGIVTVQVSVVAPNEQNTEFQGYIRVENRNNQTDYDLIPVYLKTPTDTPVVQMVNHPFLTQLWQRYLHFRNLFFQKMIEGLYYLHQDNQILREIFLR
jgi:Arylsulfotransferase (ASST)